MSELKLVASAASVGHKVSIHEKSYMKHATANEMKTAVCRRYSLLNEFILKIVRNLII
jgi:hypothetical protein